MPYSKPGAPGTWTLVDPRLRKRLYRVAKELDEDPVAIVEGALLYWLDANDSVSDNKDWMISDRIDKALLTAKSTRDA